MHTRPLLNQGEPLVTEGQQGAVSGLSLMRPIPCMGVGTTNNPFHSQIGQINSFNAFYLDQKLERLNQIFKSEL